ncbi:uncharacterized protein LOC114741009 [Neltuma alba]|uniref:uncharacterized protein LOC114741009 n=1 Tax=Neltuma alba TaxID=207710 RepID=UPI0010A41D93|nr:uncharacterized protein LOC114741009 [Prosopis alba]
MGCDDYSHHRSQSSQLLQPSSPSPPPSSSSSESSFRELEDAFLQTQTRIWLGEVLQIRLDENLVISEVLADGELLFQVSKVVWRLLLAKHTDLRHIKAFQHLPFASKENSGRYRPYSNVDSFLKICKILGLTGIDLFSPSDVVEKRNTRKVCMCIRSFSKKARSKNVNVPDFDVVSCTITMPKNIVGCLRRNLESSQSSLADSPTYYMRKQAEAKHRQGYSLAASPTDHETYLEEYDATEINHAELRSEAEFELLSSEESLHPCSENKEHDCGVAWSSSPRDNSHLDTRVKHVQESGFMGFDYSDQSLFGGRDALEQVATSNLEEDNTPNVHHSASSHGSNSTPRSIEYDRGYLDICDNMEVMRNWSMEPVNLSSKFDARDNLETLGSVEIHNDRMDQWNQIIGYKSQEAMEHRKMAYEIAPNANYLLSVEKFEGDNNSLYSNVHESEDLLSFQSYLSSEFCKWDQKGKCALISPNDRRSFTSSLPKVGSCEENTPCGRHKSSEVKPSEPNEEEVEVKLDIDGEQTNKDCQVVLSNVEGVDYHEKCPSNEEDANDNDTGDRGERVLYVVTDEDVSHTRSCLPNECSKLECEDDDQEYQHDMDPTCHSKYTIETRLPEEITPEDEKASDNLAQKTEESVERPRGKPQNNLMLKSVLGGTAAVGMLVMFLHFRRSGREKDPASIKTSSGDTAKAKVQKYPSQKTQRRSRTEGVYPAEKLKLGG